MRRSACQPHCGSAYAALLDGRTILDLAEGLQLRRARVMGANRIELTGYTEAMRERLRASDSSPRSSRGNCASLCPSVTDGAAVLDKLLDLYPIVRISEREAA